MSNRTGHCHPKPADVSGTSQASQGRSVSDEIALVPRVGEPLRKVVRGGPATFVLGSEREGLPADVLAKCDLRATIPQTPAAESLNVAMAGAIALYERRRS